MEINLPDYKNHLLNKGLKYPLDTIEASATGLLNKLPAPLTLKTGWPWTEEVHPAIYDKNINWPRLSIVTPSFNQGAFIEETIRSVLLQNYPNLEFIIIDGGSTDGSKKIIEKYAPWISYWQSEKDRGQSHAINLGFSLATGDYRAWINSDDYYMKDVFHLVTGKFLSSRVDFIYGYGYNYQVKTSEFKLSKVHPLLDYFIRIPALAQPSCFWSANVHQPVNEELQCSLDYELWLRLVKGNTRKLIKQPLSVANIHEDAKTSNSKMDAAWSNDHRLICSKDMHGPVYDWDRRLFLHKVYTRINNLIDKLNLY